MTSRRLIGGLLGLALTVGAWGPGVGPAALPVPAAHAHGSIVTLAQRRAAARLHELLGKRDLDDADWVHVRAAFEDDVDPAVARVALSVVWVHFEAAPLDVRDGPAGDRMRGVRSLSAVLRGEWDRARSNVPQGTIGKWLSEFSSLSASDFEARVTQYDYSLLVADGAQHVRSYIRSLAIHRHVRRVRHSLPLEALPDVSTRTPWEALAVECAHLPTSDAVQRIVRHYRGVRPRRSAKRNTYDGRRTWYRFAERELTVTLLGTYGKPGRQALRTALREHLEARRAAERPRDWVQCAVWRILFWSPLADSEERESSIRVAEALIEHGPGSPVQQDLVRLGRELLTELESK